MEFESTKPDHCCICGKKFKKQEKRYNSWGLSSAESDYQFCCEKCFDKHQKDINQYEIDNLYDQLEFYMECTTTKRVKGNMSLKDFFRFNQLLNKFRDRLIEKEEEEQ